MVKVIFNMTKRIRNLNSGYLSQRIQNVMWSLNGFPSDIVPSVVKA